MSSGSPLLSLGTPSDLNAAASALTELCARLSIGRILFERGGLLGARLAQGGHPLNGLPRLGWLGDQAIREGLRPPCVGIDRVRAVLCDARDLAPVVVVWGPVWAFKASRRISAWDVPQAVVVAEVGKQGLSGWGWVGDRLVRLPEESG